MMNKKLQGVSFLRSLSLYLTCTRKFSVCHLYVVRMSADHLYTAHTGLLYDRHMCKDMFDDSLYILCTYVLYTMYILSTYLQTTANAGFRGARRDEDIQAGGRGG